MGYCLECQKVTADQSTYCFIQQIKKNEAKPIVYCDQCTQRYYDFIFEKIQQKKWKPSNHQAKQRFLSSSLSKKTEPLSNLIGLTDIKEQLHALKHQLRQKQLLLQHGITVPLMSYHSIVFGQKGSGKTTLAHTMADFFIQLNLASSVQSVTRVDLVDGYVGKTALKTKKVIEESLGGILIVENVETLLTEGNDFGKEALLTLIEAMEHHKQQFIVIFTCDLEKSDELFETYKNLSSYLFYHFFIPDYTDKELTNMMIQTFTNMGYQLTFETDSLLSDMQTFFQNNPHQKTALAIHQLIHKIIQQHSAQISEKEFTSITHLTLSQIQSVLQPELPSLEHYTYIRNQALEKLHTFIGLETLKAELQLFINYTTVLKMKQTEQLPLPSITNHMLFLGNPGTGKTTIARILGEFLKGLGILSKGHFIEASKQSFLQGTGEISTRAKKCIQKAKGGILFIDEAYTLCSDIAGKEIIDTLIKEMEDNRHDLIVIFAGYEEDMVAFLETNAGLSSRLSHVFHFPNYSKKELVEIVLQQCQDYHLKLLPTAKKKLTSLMSEQPNGNGRWARTFVEKLVMIQSNRIMHEQNASLTSIKSKDIEQTFEKMNQRHLQFN